MFSEISHKLKSAAALPAVHSKVTQSDVAFFADDQTWVAYQGPQMVAALTKMVVDKGLKGVAAFDSASDTVDRETGKFTYELIKAGDLQHPMLIGFYFASGRLEPSCLERGPFLSRERRAFWRIGPLWC
jgi:hypothetical protein